VAQFAGGYMFMLMFDLDLNGCIAQITYHKDTGSYVANLYHRGMRKHLASKSFGNGVAAEDWILAELSFPESILILKYS